MVHIDNNKFNILTVTSLHGAGKLTNNLHHTAPVITTTWENVGKVASGIILIILIIAQTMEPFTRGIFDEEREQC